MQSIIKTETTSKKFRLFKNRFASYVLQEKPKNAPKSQWVIINAFAQKTTAKNQLQSVIKNQLKNELSKLVSSN